MYLTVLRCLFLPLTEERKLFLGMLSRKTTEQEVRLMFGAFGQIEECTILREQNGESKGEHRASLSYTCIYLYLYRDLTSLALA